MEKLYTVSKTRPEADCAKFRLTLKKVGKTIRTFRYDVIKSLCLYSGGDK